MRCMRVARCITPGAIYHVISRFVDHPWFLADELERDHHRAWFAAAMDRSDWRTLASCLMPDRIHHVMAVGTESLESWVDAVQTPFAQWLSFRRDRIGPVFADRT